MLRRPARTARLRLTLLYSGMFLALGTLVILVTYALARGGHVVGSSSQGVAVQVAPSGVRKLALPASPVLQQRQHDLARLLAVSWLVLALTAVLSAVLGWIAAGRVLRPLRQMTTAARTISAGNLGERLALTGPEDEFKQLGDTLDDLLARLEASFEAQRRFVANASHELRTPLTLERTLLQVALADPDASAKTLRATCEELLASGRDQERMLEALLTLASTERGLEQVVQLDLAAIAQRVVTGREADLAARQIELTCELEPALVAGEPALIERMAANLLDNAVRHNIEGGKARLSTATVGEQARLTVANTGPLIPAGELERLFEPFQRLGNGRVAGDGHGLGLSIVRAIAGVHGGTVRATPREGGGLEVEVNLPAG